MAVDVAVLVGGAAVAAGLVAVSEGSAVGATHGFVVGTAVASGFGVWVGTTVAVGGMLVGAAGATVLLDSGVLGVSGAVRGTARVGAAVTLVVAARWVVGDASEAAPDVTGCAVAVARGEFDRRASHRVPPAADCRLQVDAGIRQQ